MIHMHEQIKNFANVVLNQFFFSIDGQQFGNNWLLAHFFSRSIHFLFDGCGCFAFEVLPYLNEAYLLLTNCKSACGHFGWSWLAENLIGCPKCTRLQLFHDNDRNSIYRTALHCTQCTVHICNYLLLQKSLLSDRMECSQALNILIVFRCLSVVQSGAVRFGWWFHWSKMLLITWKTNI